MPPAPVIPKLVNASVDGLGNVITLYFDQQLDSENLPLASQFSVMNGNAASITRVNVVNNQVVLTLDEKLDTSLAVTVSYNDVSVGNDVSTLQAKNGNDVASFSGIDVRNSLSLTEGGEGSFAYASSITLAGAEISAFDASSNRLFVTSNSGLQVVSVDSNLKMQLLGTLSLGSNDITSVAVKNGIVAVAVANADKSQPGTVYFLEADAAVGSGMVLNSVTVGALPDMVTFTPDGTKVLVANEGEMGGSSNPEGSVSIINVNTCSVTTASFSSFNDQAAALRAEGVRLFAGQTGFESVSVAQDLEPEYISISPDGTKAFVTLQENNAIAILDIATGTFTDIVPLGLKSFEALPFDGSDKDGINLQTGSPVFGQYMPDAIASFIAADGKTYYVIANEGDDRDDFISPDETKKVSSLTLDSTAFPDAVLLKRDNEIGPLKVSQAPGNNGNTDGDGDVDQLLSYGARSFSIIDENGRIVFDSGSQIDQFMAAGGVFTGAGGTGLFDDSRSDNKGAEPEGVTIAQVDGKTMAFISLERGGGGVMVYDVTDPSSVEFVQYLRHAGDESPEGLSFVDGSDSPSGQGLLFVSNEVSGTVSIYRTNEAPVVLEGIDDMSAAAGSEFDEILLANTFSDSDAGDSLTYTATLADGSALPEWLQFQASHHDTAVMKSYFLGDGSTYAADTSTSKARSTDSASAITAIVTGMKTDAGNISWQSGDPANGQLTTIAESLRAEEGFAIGVASTVPFTHATPAGVVSHNVNRNNYQQIGHEILFTTQPEVVIGGGYNSSMFANGNADYTAFVNGTDGTDYVFVQRTAGLDGGDTLAATAAGVDLASGEKLFGLYGTSGGNFEYYKVSDTPGTPAMARESTDSTPSVDEDPTLADVTKASLSVLNQDPDGFFIMIEQGDIDWSDHANDYENMIGGVYDLDQAVKAAENYVESGSMGISWENTLIIVTSDHSNSYMRAQTELGQGDLPKQAGVPYAFTYPDGEVTYSSSEHTNELVTISARGAGADLFEEYAGDIYAGTDIIDNTQIYDVMMKAAKEAGADHVILFIGDGMNVEHEIAGSRYLYGEDFGLSWQQWSELDNGWSGYATTWDVSSYNTYANLNSQALFNTSNPDSINPLIGYDPSKGGETPCPVEMTFSGKPDKGETGVFEIMVTATDESGASTHDTFMLTVTDKDYDETEGSDTLNGDSGNNVIFGDKGNDFLNGNDGDDILNGDEGNDTMRGGKGDDTYYVDSTGDLVNENSSMRSGVFSFLGFGGNSWGNSGGSDTVKSSVDWTLGNNIENLELIGTDDLNGTGNSLDNRINGNGGDNLLDGLAGNDTIDGGEGSDTMRGGLGNDLFLVDHAGDVVTEASRAGTDTVQSFVDWVLGDNVEYLELEGSDALAGTGNAIGNRITGNCGDNLLDGLGGNDTLLGGLGSDTLYGGTGNDDFLGGTGADILVGGNGQDIFIYTNADDSGITAETMDVILDFVSRQDKIDLSGIDANTMRSGDQMFSRVILGSSSAFTSAGQLRFDSADGILYGNTDNDAQAEFAVRLDGVSSLRVTDVVF
jgi:alkaline phosphatase